MLVIFTEVMGNEKFPTGLRISTMEGMRVLAGNLAGQVKESEYFVKTTLPVYVRMIAEN